MFSLIIRIALTILIISSIADLAPINNSSDGLLTKIYEDYGIEDDGNSSFKISLAPVNQQNEPPPSQNILMESQEKIRNLTQALKRVYQTTKNDSITPENFKSLISEGLFDVLELANMIYYPAKSSESTISSTLETEAFSRSGIITRSSSEDPISEDADVEPLTNSSHELQHERPVKSHSFNDTRHQDRDMHNSSHDSDHKHEHHGVHVATWNFDYVQEPIILTMFTMAIAVVKILFHHCKKLHEIFPESCLLILMGLGMGCIFLLDQNHHYYSFLAFDGKTFFLFLLPPIILEAAYSLKDRSFHENIGTILIFAVFGTVMNAAIIGVSLYLFGLMGAFGSLNISIFQCLIFSSLIAAVDPVAVLAIFQEVGVNKILYYLVFGESLLNDAVTVVLYNLMVSFDQIPQIEAKDIGLGLAAFVCVSIGGLLIGVVCGFITACVTKYTAKIRVVEPVMLFGMAYASYLLAEMVHFSGIISIIGCGLIQAQYAVENISSKSYITVHYFSKVASSVTESMIFIILGVMLVNNHQYWHDWNTAFTLLALFLVIGARFFSQFVQLHLASSSCVFSLTFCVNRYMYGTRAISYQEQLIMAYGGLRGAMSFSLVFLLDSNIATKNTMMCASYVIVLFTVFVQVVDNMAAAVEEIVGHHGASYWTAMAKYFSQHFVRPAIQKNPTRKASSMVTAAEESSMIDQVKRKNSVSSLSTMNSLWGELKQFDQGGITPEASEYMLEFQDRQRSDSEHEMRRTASVASIDASMIPDISEENPQGLFNLRKLMTPIAHKLHFSTFDRNLTRDHSHGHHLGRHIKNMHRVRKHIHRHRRHKSIAKHNQDHEMTQVDSETSLKSNVSGQSESSSTSDQSSKFGSTESTSKNRKKTADETEAKPEEKKRVLFQLD